MVNLLDKQFVVIAGKGGVGKTTVALILGHLAASRGRRTLVCLCNAPPRFNDLLSDVEIDSTIRRVTTNFDVVNLEPKAAQKEYGLLKLRSRTLNRLVFSSRVIRAFLDAVPGLSEWALIGKATYHAMQTNHGRPVYDLVLFDSPATGHGLDILSLPRAIAAAVPSGMMREEALARRRLMENPDLSEVLPVTLPEEIPVNETVEFVAGLEKLNLAVNRVVVNMLVPHAVGADLAARTNAHNGLDNQPSWLLPVAAALGRQQIQEESLSRLKSLVPAEQICLPFIPGGSLDQVALRRISEALATGVAPNEAGD
jgi:anion-transporting  ArsA/GET3 family ATPase